MSKLFKLVDKQTAYDRLYDFSLLPKDQQTPGDLPLQIHCIMGLMMWGLFIKHSRETPKSWHEFNQGYNKITRRLKSGVTLKRPAVRSPPGRNSIPTELPGAGYRTSAEWAQGRSVCNDLLNGILK